MKKGREDDVHSMMYLPYCGNGFLEKRDIDEMKQFIILLKENNENNELNLLWPLN